MIARFFYRLLWWFAIPVALVRLAIKSLSEPAYRRNLTERFGRYPDSNEPCIWVHAVSVGEAKSVIPLVRQWLALNPNDHFLLTVTTPAGRSVLKAAAIEHADVYYAPWDCTLFVSRVFNRRAIRALWLVEKEIWPELLFHAEKNNVPVATVSMTVSKSSANKYHKFGRLFNEFRAISKALCQNDEAVNHAQIFIEPEKVVDAGNLKFDLSIPLSVEEDADSLRASFNLQGRKLILFASTHRGEEGLIHCWLEELLHNDPNTVIAIMPRHPQRFDEVKTLFSDYDSLARSDNKPLQANQQLLVIDVMGEALTWMKLSHLVVVCGSLVEGIGGHNVLEPIALKKTTVVGPYNDNNKNLVEQLVVEKAISRLSIERFPAALLPLIQEEPSEQIERATRIFNEGKGAVDRHIHYLEKLT